MKSKWYFTKSYKKYFAVNAKGGKLQRFINDYIYILFDKESMNEFINEIKQKCKSLDQEYPRTTPLEVCFEKEKHLFYIGYKLAIYKRNRPDAIVVLDFAEVRRIEHYQTEIDFEKGTKK